MVGKRLLAGDELMILHHIRLPGCGVLYLQAGGGKRFVVIIGSGSPELWPFDLFLFYLREDGYMITGIGEIMGKLRQSRKMTCHQFLIVFFGLRKRGKKRHR